MPLDENPYPDPFLSNRQIDRFLERAKCSHGIGILDRCEGCEELLKLDEEETSE